MTGSYILHENLTLLEGLLSPFLYNVVNMVFHPMLLCFSSDGTRIFNNVFKCHETHFFTDLNICNIFISWIAVKIIFLFTNLRFFATVITMHSASSNTFASFLHTIFHS